MMKSIHDIYSRDETFIDEFAHDLDDCAVWFNESEFARFHTIGDKGKKVLSIFIKNVTSQNIPYKSGRDDNPEGVAKAIGILYCRVKDIKGNFLANSPLKIDGKLYTITEASILQDHVWRVSLEANK